MYSIVVLDDEVLTLKMLERLIDWPGLGLETPLCYTSAAEAGRAIERKMPDILLTDIRMPGLSGLELVRRLRALENNMEVLIMSAYADFSYAQEAISLGCCAYVLKPIDEKVLEEKLRDVVRRLDQKEAGRRGRYELPEGCSAPVRDCVRWLTAHYTEALTLEQISEACAVSKTYLSGLFRKEAGVTIWEYLLRLRMAKAAALLRSGRLYSYEIAERVGYDDANYFSRLFRKYYGCSPNEFRQRNGAIRD